jgi:hypothetical protein
VRAALGVLIAFWAWISDEKAWLSWMVSELQHEINPLLNAIRGKVTHSQRVVESAAFCELF